MRAPLEVHLALLDAGWLRLELTAGEQHLVALCSTTPYASLTELASWLLGLCEGACTGVVHWNTEPIEFQFEATMLDHEQTRLRVVRYPDHRRVLGQGTVAFEVVAPARALCRVFWRALRALQSRPLSADDARHWGELPAREIELLGQKLRIPAPR